MSNIFGDCNGYIVVSDKVERGCRKIIDDGDLKLFKFGACEGLFCVMLDGLLQVLEIMFRRTVG